MEIIKQSHEIMSLNDDALQQIERAGRTCYQSQDRITEDSAEKFVAMLLKREHKAMIEFADITVKFITNRGVTHELVRHRHCNFAQESTRYVKYDGGMQFILPVWMGEKYLGVYDTNRYMSLYHKQFPGDKIMGESIFLQGLHRAEIDYQELRRYDWQAQQAREALPNALKTEICMKTNIRDWLHIFGLRTSKAAHPQMRILMIGLLNELKVRLPTVFGEINA